ncbi:MAG: glycosyltransferase, partial [Oligoflexales bacterium]
MSRFRVILFLFLYSVPLEVSAQNIIIFWYGMGLGHRVPAERIAKYIQNSYNDSPNLRIRLVDVNDFILFDPLSEETGKAKYLKWATHNADSYTRYFQWYLERNPEDLKSNFDLNKLSYFLYDEKPDVVVSTFWGAAHALYLLKRKFPDTLNVPVGLLYTDYEVRNFVSMVPVIDAIFLPSRTLRDRIEDKYPDLLDYSDSFYSSGIPINHEYLSVLKRMPAEELRADLSLSTCSKIICIARGGEAQIPIVDLVQRILEELKLENIQIVVLAGKSKSDHEALVKLQQYFGEGKVVKVGSVSNETYLKYIVCADVMITKPGGVTITETAISEVPMVFLTGLGGQEQDNFKEFLDNKMALDGSSVEEAIASLQTILKNPKAPQLMVDAQKEYFALYHPEKISDWVVQQKNDSTDWSDFHKEASSMESRSDLQGLVDLNPIALKNWFYYLNDLSQCDLNEDSELKRKSIETSIAYIERSIINVSKDMLKNKEIMGDESLSYADKMYTKWRYLRQYVLKQSFSGYLNKKCEKPDRQFMVILIQDLLKFTDSDSFNEDDRKWEFTQDLLFSDLANYYYIENSGKRALSYLDGILDYAEIKEVSESVIQLKGNIFIGLGRFKSAIEHFEHYLK